MAKIEAVKEELATLREEYKSLFLYLLATVTGMVTSFYQVVTGKVDLYILVLSVLGFVSATFIMLLIKKVRLEIDNDIKKLGEIEWW